MKVRSKSAEARSRYLSLNTNKSFPTTPTISSCGHSEIAESSPNVPADKSSLDVGFVKTNPSHSSPLAVEEKPFEKLRCQEDQCETSSASPSTADPTSPTPLAAEGRRASEDSPVARTAFFPIRSCKLKAEAIRKKRTLFQEYRTQALPETDRTFRCPRCSYKGRHRSAVASHFFTHTQEKPFDCPRCSRSFSMLYELGRHIKNRHLDVKIYRCNFCPFFCNSNKSFKQHVQKQHKTKVRMLPLENYFQTYKKN